MWDAIPSIPDLQCSWQVLLQCAGPQCHHLLRTVPPRQCAKYAHGHDSGRRTMEALLGRIPGSPMQVKMARNITTPPMRMGGLGLRSALKTAPGAFWASWADALPMLQQRLPRLTGQITHHLSHPDALGCVGELLESVSRLDRDGFIARPCWEMLQRGARPRPPLIVEPGEWHHGWQHHSSSSSEHHFRETVVLAQSCAADQAHLRSHSGPCASQVLHGAREAVVVPHVSSREAPIATIDQGGQVRVRWFSGFSRPTLCSMPTLRPSAFQSCPHRTHPRARVPRGWCHREAERQVVGHEHQRPSDGRTGNRSVGFWIGVEPRCAAGSGHYSPECSHSMRAGTPQEQRRQAQKHTKVSVFFW